MVVSPTLVKGSGCSLQLSGTGLALLRGVCAPPVLPAPLEKFLRGLFCMCRGTQSVGTGWSPKIFGGAQFYLRGPVSRGPLSAKTSPWGTHMPGAPPFKSGYRPTFYLEIRLKGGGLCLHSYAFRHAFEKFTSLYLVPIWLRVCRSLLLRQLVLEVTRLKLR